MKTAKQTHGELFEAVAAGILSVLTVWQLPNALDLPDQTVALGQAISVVLAVTVFLLYREAFAMHDNRLRKAAFGTGAFFSLCTVLGKPLQVSGAYTAISLLSALGSILLWALLTLLFGAALLVLFRAASGITTRTKNAEKESTFSRLSGNGFIVFLFLLLCWVPFWLAFWPGTFVYDSGTQFYTYYDWVITTHHPILHTLLLGFCMSLGIDSTEDGSATTGLAVYSAVQMILLAAMLAYAIHWMRRRAVPTGVRITVTLLFAIFPFYPIWSFSAQKDVLFGGLAMLFVLQLVDLWLDGYRLLQSPWRIAGFIATAVLMMLMRNNGVYALLVLAPFGIVWAKGARWRVTALLAGCVAAYLAANGALIWATEATSACKVEFLSIPLQQIARTLRDDPAAIAEDTDGVIDTLYDTSPAEVYNPQVADPVKWATYYDEVDENVPQLLSLWVRMGVHHLQSYAEAFLVQNLPYYLPGAPMAYRFDLGVVQMDMFPIEEHSYFPALRELCQKYDQTLTLWGLPGARLLSDTAFFVWLAIAGFALAWYRRQKHLMAGFLYLLAIWATCLVGPVAIIRYMLALFYAVPILWATLFVPVVEKTNVNGQTGLQNVTDGADRLSMAETSAENT